MINFFTDPENYKNNKERKTVDSLISFFTKINSSIDDFEITNEENWIIVITIKLFIPDFLYIYLYIYKIYIYMYVCILYICMFNIFILYI
mgnify:CR=1 FL=1